MSDGQKSIPRWVVAAITTGALLGGAAYAQSQDCWKCWPCGSADDGGYIMCCQSYDCQQ